MGGWKSVVVRGEGFGKVGGGGGGNRGGRGESKHVNVF